MLQRRRYIGDGSSGSDSITGFFPEIDLVTSINNALNPVYSQMATSSGYGNAVDTVYQNLANGTISSTQAAQQLQELANVGATTPTSMPLSTYLLVGLVGLLVLALVIK